MSAASKGKKIKLRKTILAHSVSTGEVFVLDTDTSAVFQLAGDEARVVAVLASGESNSGIFLHNLASKLPGKKKLKPDQLLAVLAKLEIMQIMEKSGSSKAIKIP
jgi:hypothetical protein